MTDTQMSTRGAASRQTSLLGEAFTYFLTCPFGRVWGGVNILKNGVWQALTGRFPSKTLLIDASVVSYSQPLSFLFPLTLHRCSATHATA